MGLMASDTGGGSYTPVPVGLHLARCYQIIDLGTQETTYNGDTKLSHKVRIAFELFGEDSEGKPLTIQYEGETKPMTIGKEYTMSLGEKANLTHDLNSWRGRAFTEEEKKGFLLTNVMGAYGMVNVTHNVSRNGKTYANISGINPIPSALKNAKPNPVHPNQSFDLDNPDYELFDSLPEWLQEKIKASREWQERTGVAATPKVTPDPEMDDVPF